MVAASGNYQRIVRLLKQWPTEEGKRGRDLGDFLRNKINTALENNKFDTDFKYWDSQYFALRRLLNDEHRNKYPRALTSSATGLTAEQCKSVLSNDFLDELQKQDQPFYKNIFSKLKKSQ